MFGLFYAVFLFGLFLIGLAADLFADNTWVVARALWTLEDACRVLSSPTYAPRPAPRPAPTLRKAPPMPVSLRPRAPWPAPRPPSAARDLLRALPPPRQARGADGRFLPVSPLTDASYGRIL